jgi:hypothetical protein
MRLTLYETVNSNKGIDLSRVKWLPDETNRQYKDWDLQNAGLLCMIPQEHLWRVAYRQNLSGVGEWWIRNELLAEDEIISANE